MWSDYIVHISLFLFQFSHVSLPIERTSVECKLRYAELAVDIMNEHAVDERLRRNKEARKDSVEKVYEKWLTLLT